MLEEESKQSKGGQARAEVLSPEERSAIAKAAADARWGNARAAIREGVLNIGGNELQCYVLDDETRILARASFVRAIGRKGKVKGGAKFDAELQTPVFLTAENLKPFITKEIEGNSNAVIFVHKGQKMIGYKAQLLADVCDVFEEAKRAGALRQNQLHIAEACRILAKGLTRVGIIGLVDEATGYQRDRAADALAQILERFIAKELRPWVRTFPEDYYEQLFRLRGLKFPTDTVQKPMYFGHLTNDIIYRRLAPGVLDELKAVTPKDAKGRRKHQLHRRLSEEVGHPKLREHLASVVTIMKLSDDYTDFQGKLNRIHRKYNETIPMDFDDNEDEEPTGL